VRTRIQEPLGKKKKGGKDARAGAAKAKAKTRNFTVAARPAQRPSPAQDEAPFNNAAFVMSVHDPRELPPPGLPEVAFAGRSNAGKSSAINTLAGRRRLAFVSKTPGRTQLINFFSLGGEAFLVDLPGYGYAGVPGEVREHWKHLVGTYIAERPSLAAVVVVMDVRHPLTELDRTLLEWLREAGRSTHVLLTKADKLSKQARQVTLAKVKRALGGEFPGTSVQLFSSMKREGVAEAASTLKRLAAQKNKAPPKGE
jgi:GTP-binding protein